MNRGVTQRVLPGLESGIQEARGGDEIGQPPWIISPPLRRDARVKPVHDDAGSAGVVQRVLPGLEPGIQEPRGGDEIGQPSWIISPPLRRDARVKPVHDDFGHDGNGWARNSPQSPVGPISRRLQRPDEEFPVFRGTGVFRPNWELFRPNREFFRPNREFWLPDPVIQKAAKTR
jgi:hypothetical protein